MSSVKKIACFVIFVVMFASVAFAADPPEYDSLVIDPIADHKSKAFGVNDDGDVVGRFYQTGADGDTNKKAFFWDYQTQTSQLLDPSLVTSETSAYDINNNGIVSGYSTDSNDRITAARWDSSNQMLLNLATLATSPLYEPNNPNIRSRAFKINDNGIVAGYSYVSDLTGVNRRTHAVVFGDVPSDPIRDLGTLTNAYPIYQNGFSVARDININGAVVGTAVTGRASSSAPWDYAPFIYDLDLNNDGVLNDAGSMQALAMNPLQSGAWTATAINDSGLIGGHVTTGDNQKSAYYWNNASAAPAALDVLSEGYSYAEIFSINNVGQMVGSMWNLDPTTLAITDMHAFYVDVDKIVYDLNNLLTPAADAAWELIFANDINESGQICGFGLLNGEERGYLLTVTPEPLSCVLFPLGIATLGFFKRKMK